MDVPYSTSGYNSHSNEKVDPVARNPGARQTGRQAGSNIKPPLQAYSSILETDCGRQHTYCCDEGLQFRRWYRACGRRRKEGFPTDRKRKTKAKEKAKEEEEEKAKIQSESSRFREQLAISRAQSCGHVEACS
ncbi:unnamed protein product [Calypogeia fissa]